LKASYGRVSTRGVLPLAWSLDHVGPLCRSARDAGVVLGALSTPVSVSRMPARSLRLGVPRAVFFDDLDPAAATIVAGALRDLSGLAAGVQDVRLPSLPTPPELPTLPLTYAQVIQAEAYAFHQPLLTTRPDLYHPGTRRSIENGAAIPAAGYILARREMERLRESTAQLFSGVDLLITPSAPGPAFPLGQPGGLVFLRNSAPSNLYGLPALSIPCGFTPAGLPVGLQITGPAGREDQVLALAVAYQDSTSWHRRHPPL
jgi:aspartyl-tRNA(Asn)/glutamyl-tRNA(Gln) amidotransferase subunit A